MGGRPADYDGVLTKIKGAGARHAGAGEDLLVLVPMSEHTLSVVKHAKGSFYDDVDHAPFYRAADRYNAELAAFVRATAR